MKEFKQPLGCFFFPLILSFFFSGRAGSDHSGSALRGGLWLSDYSAERVGQAHAVLAPFSHKYLSHQVRSLSGSVLLGWKYVLVLHLSAWFLATSSLILHSTLQVCRFSVGMEQVYVAVTLVEHRNVPLHTCGVFLTFCTGTRMAEAVPTNSRWPAIPSRMWTTGGLSKILECEYARDLNAKLL